VSVTCDVCRSSSKYTQILPLLLDAYEWLVNSNRETDAGICELYIDRDRSMISIKVIASNSYKFTISIQRNLAFRYIIKMDENVR